MFKRLKGTAFERRSRRNKHDIIRTWINFSAGKLKACSRLRIAVKKPEWSFSDKIPGKIDPALAAEQHLDIRTGKRLQLRRIFYDFCHKKTPFQNLLKTDMQTDRVLNNLNKIILFSFGLIYMISCKNTSKKLQFFYPRSTQIFSNLHCICDCQQLRMRFPVTHLFYVP